MKSRVWIILAAIALFAALQYRQAAAVKRLTKTGEFFGSIVKVDVCYQERDREALDEVLQQVWSRFADIHSRMSVYDPQSDINNINRAYHAPVTVGEDTYERVRNSIRYHALSRGVFDITVGPLIALWKSKGKQGMMPTPEEITAAMSKVDIQAVLLMDNFQIQLHRDAVKINIDSIGDGFAADEAAKILRAGGFQDFLVDASGELYAAGHNCRGENWHIGIRDPHDTDKIIDILQISDQAVSTSGSYERFYEIDGKKYSHIIDPRTGYPAQGVISATVVAPSAEFADFLSTAFCILSPEESLSIIDSLGADYAAMMVTESGDEQRVFNHQYHRFSEWPPHVSTTRKSQKERK